ncbi:unnamed protein product, partial [Adineta steineri]
TEDKHQSDGSTPRNPLLAEANHSDDTNAVVSTGKDNVAENPQIIKKDTVFIRDLPLVMTEQRLFDTLFDEFSTVGQIKRDEQTSQPCIDLIKARKDKTRLTGNAKVTFEQEESVEKAIEKYNGKRVETLNDAQIFVEKLKAERSASTPAPRPLLPPAPRPLLQPVPPPQPLLLAAPTPRQLLPPALAPQLISTPSKLLSSVRPAGSEHSQKEKNHGLFG